MCDESLSFDKWSLNILTQSRSGHLPVEIKKLLVARGLKFTSLGIVIFGNTVTKNSPTEYVCIIRVLEISE